MFAMHYWHLLVCRVREFWSSRKTIRQLRGDIRELRSSRRQAEETLKIQRQTFLADFESQFCQQHAEYERELQVQRLTRIDLEQKLRDSLAEATRLKIALEKAQNRVALLEDENDLLANVNTVNHRRVRAMMHTGVEDVHPRPSPEEPRKPADLVDPSEISTLEGMVSNGLVC